MSHYGKLIKQTKYLLLEWHSWHNGGGGKEQIHDRLNELNFNVRKETKEIRVEGEERSVGLILAESNVE